MGRNSRIIVCFTLLIALSSVAGLRAQWTQSVPNLVGPEEQRIGSICFSNGVVWAGATNTLFSSTDSGRTWNQSQSFPAEEISDIAFYDSLNGIIGTFQSGVFQTQDGGVTWSNVIQSNGSATYNRVAFNGSANVMHVLENNTSILNTSTDGGSTWQLQSFGSEGMTFAIGADKTIYVLSAGNGTWINYSTDFGVNWSQNGNINPDGDSQGLAADSCDTHRLYLVNENTRTRNPNTTKIDVTPDAGQTWQTNSSHPLDYYSGSIANTSQVLYVTTVPTSGTGVLRSTDDGASWQDIGGPTTCFDTRSIALANNNIIFVLDSNGTVWSTLNSGGNKLDLGTSTRGNPTLALSGNPQQYHSNVCGPIDSVISLAVESCVPIAATIDSVNLSGSPAFTLSQAGSFPRSLTSGDSISLRYWSTSAGVDTGRIQILYHLSGAARDTTILLIGSSTSGDTNSAGAVRQLASTSFGTNATLRLLANVAPNVSTDLIWPFLQSADLEFSFDSSRLAFSSYAPPSGWSTISAVDLGNAIEVKIQDVSSSPTKPLDLGTANFLARKNTTSLTKLPIDYLVLDTKNGQLPLCVERQEDDIWAIEVYPTSDVTQNLEDEQDIQVFPNPADNELWIRNSAEAPAFVVLSDALGRVLLSQTVPENTTGKLDIESLPSSSYILTCHVNDRTFIRRVSKLR